MSHFRSFNVGLDHIFFKGAILRENHKEKKKLHLIIKFLLLLPQPDMYLLYEVWPKYLKSRS